MAYGMLIKSSSDAVVLDTTTIVSRIVYTQSVTIVANVNQNVTIPSEYNSTNALAVTNLGAVCYISAAGNVFFNGTRSAAGTHILYVISTG
jgi:hypothetical protein